MKPTAVELFAHAADRAKDVAVMMEAARALTVLGRARLSTREAQGDEPPPDTLQVVSLYQTAERLGQHVRQVSSEARSLLYTAKRMLQSQPEMQCQVPADFEDVCRLMDEAMDRAVEAIERLDAIRLAAVPALAEGPAAIEAPPHVRVAADELFSRLRQRG
jgi:hypothetical protein